MKIGEYVYAKTHAELLNELLGTNYKAWMKSSIKLPDEKRLWMIELGNFVSSSGWINRLVTLDKISEKHAGRKFVFTGHETYVGAQLNGVPWDASDRVVFDIQRSGATRRYIFRGVFRLKKEECTLHENVWELISDEYTL